MKKYILFIFIFCLWQQGAFGQCSCYDPTWDWTTQASFQLSGMITTSTGKPLPCPFTETGTQNVDIYQLYWTGDYTKTQGWVLLYNNLGCPNGQIAGSFPYFALYNKFRGIVRFFIFNLNTTATSSAAANLTWISNSLSNSLLAYNVSSYVQPDNFYVNNPGINNNDLVTYNISGLYPNDWFVVEFPVLFDANTPPTVEQSSANGMQLTVVQNTNSDIKMSGPFSFTTNAQNASSGPSGGVTTSSGVTANSTYTFLNNASQFLGKVPSGTTLQKDLTSMQTYLQTEAGKAFSCETETNLYNAAAAISPNGAIGSFLTGVGTFASALGGGLGVAASIFDLFIGQSTPSSTFTPTISTGSISLKGNITSSTAVTSPIVQLPGSNHYNSNGLVTSGLPLYDCPLGVVTLENEPNVSQRTFTCALDARYDASLGYPNNPLAYYDLDDINYVSYKFNDNIQLALNYQAGLTVTNQAAQLVVELSSTLPTINNVLTSYKDISFLNYPSVLNTNYVNDNFLLDALNNNLYQYNGTRTPHWEDTQGNTQSVTRFLIATPFIPVNKFKNTSITVPVFSDTGSTAATPIPFKVYLKLLLTLMPTDPTMQQTPVVYVVTYDLTNNVTLDVNNSTNGYDLTVDQRINMTNNMPTFNSFDGFIGPIPLTSTTMVNLVESQPISATSGNITLSAVNQIVFQPGVSITASENYKFVANIVAPTGSVYGTDATSTIDVKNQSCNCTAVPIIAEQQQQLNKTKSAREALDINSTTMVVNVYPNPTEGMFTIANNSSDKYDVSVFDISGNLLNQIKHCQNSQEMDISEYPNGIYILKMQGKSSILTQKIVKTKN